MQLQYWVRKVVYNHAITISAIFPVYLFTTVNDGAYVLLAHTGEIGISQEQEKLRLDIPIQ